MMFLSLQVFLFLLVSFSAIQIIASADSPTVQSACFPSRPSERHVCLLAQNLQPPIALIFSYACKRHRRLNQWFHGPPGSKEGPLLAEQSDDGPLNISTSDYRNGDFLRVDGCSTCLRFHGPVLPIRDNGTYYMVATVDDKGRAERSNEIKLYTYNITGRAISSEVGCYADVASDRDLNGANIMNKQEGMTQQTCINFCYQQGYFYAGVQFGWQCYCGHNYGRYGPCQECNFTCTGDPTGQTICGGASCNTVLTTGVFSSKVVLGCYSDAEFRDLPYDRDLNVAGGNTLDLCAIRCFNKGYRYAGAQFGAECSCGNSYGRYGPSTKCNMTCSGDRKNETICGGEYSNTIMSTGLKCPRVENNSLSLSVNSRTLTSDSLVSIEDTISVEFLLPPTKAALYITQQDLTYVRRQIPYKCDPTTQKCVAAVKVRSSAVPKVFQEDEEAATIKVILVLRLEKIQPITFTRSFKLINPGFKNQEL